MSAAKEIEAPYSLSWFGIVRMGLVQTALGSIVVLTNSTFNRVMNVELGLLAMVPGLLVGLHYAVQILRPRWGHGSDVGGRRTPWIVGGMAVLACGAILAALGIAWIPTSLMGGMLLSVFAYFLIGVGVGAAGTSLLVLLAKIVAPHRRAAAATLVWVMMIAGFIVTTVIAGQLLEPFSMTRLVLVTCGVCIVAFAVTLVSVWRLEPRTAAYSASVGSNAGHATLQADDNSFARALRDVLSDREARHFTLFVFVSMLAYSMQELILEPFAGHVFGLTPGGSTKLSGVQNAGVLSGMIAIGVLATRFGGGKASVLRWWTIVGCLASAVALAALSLGAFMADSWPLRTSVFALGFANGTFAVAAIASMMALATKPSRQQATGVRREGTRMGVWGAAQAIAFGLGGFAGTVLADISRSVLAADAPAYALVFFIEGGLFLVAALLALGLSAQADSEPGDVGRRETQNPLTAIGEQSLSEAGQS